MQFFFLSERLDLQVLSFAYVNQLDVGDFDSGTNTCLIWTILRQYSGMALE